MGARKAELAWVAAAAAITIAVVLAVMVENRIALALAGLGVLLIGLRFPKTLTLATGITLPFSGALAFSVGGVFVAATDILAAAAIIAIAIDRKTSDAKLGRAARISGPIIWLALPYYLIATLQTLYLHDAAGVLTVLQRIELVLLWVVFGAIATLAGYLRPFLYGFIASALLLSVVWIATPGVGGVLGAQKNPSGGFIAAAILIVVLSRRRYRLIALAILTAGLIATGSRGSIVGLAAAVVVVALAWQQWRRTVVPLGIAVLAGASVFYLMPPEFTARFLGQDNAGSYTQDIRGVFFDDAVAQQMTSPGGQGVGVGSYRQLDFALQRIETHDPHNVFVLAFAEGGWPLLASFFLLVVGALVVLLRGGRSPIVVAALAVQVSTFVHAAVDVYWVRGTPAPGWALTGAALAVIFLAGQPVERPSRDIGLASDLLPSQNPRAR